MDQIDRVILSALRKNARSSIKQISEQVFLSPPATAARIERLEQEGIITGYHAAVDPSHLGCPITAFVQVVLLPEKQEQFCAFARRSRHVLECYHVTGVYSMLLKACFAQAQQMSDFVAEVQKYGKTQTQMVFSPVIDWRDCFWQDHEW